MVSRTVLSWLHTLEEPYRSRAVAAAVYDGVDKHLVISLQDAIMRFGWIDEHNRNKDKDLIPWSRIYNEMTVPTYKKYLKK